MCIRLTILAIVLASPPRLAQAQAWDDRQANIVSAGFGLHAGGLGISYRRMLAVAPLAVGVGYGAYGPAAFMELSAARLRSLFPSRDAGESRVFVSIGLLGRERGDGPMAAGDVFVELGAQLWPGTGQRLFGEIGLGLAKPAWGVRPSWTLMPAFRAQVGAGF